MANTNETVNTNAMTTHCKHHHRVLALLLAALMALFMVGTVSSQADAAGNKYNWSSLGLSSSTTMKCYLSGTGSQSVYITNLLALKTGSVSASDEITVLQIGKNSLGSWYAKIKYRSTKTGYIALSKLSSVTSGSFSDQKTAVAKISTVYCRAANTVYKNNCIPAGAKVYIVTKSGKYTQVVYSVSGGWKMGWIANTTAADYLTNTCSVSGIKNGSTVALTVGATKNLSASVVSGASVTWYTSNSSVAALSSTTSKTPVLTAKSAGTATITMKVNNTSYSYKFGVKVTEVIPTGISLNKTSCTLTSSSPSVTLTAAVAPSNATNKSVTWSSSNTSAATVSGGKVTAVGNGKTTITAKDAAGHTASCSVSVSLTNSNTDIAAIVSRLRNNKSLGLSSSKKEGMAAFAEVLLKAGYEPSFVAGVLGNYAYEANSGGFESSAYKPASNEPPYLCYADSLYNYRTKFSGKNITSVSLSEVKSMLQSMKKDSYKKGKFGLGCLQWTGGRTMTLVDLYIAEAGGSDRITMAQVRTAEGKMILKELSGSYKSVYTSWKKSNASNLNSADAAYNAGKAFMLYYEVPNDRSASAISKRSNKAKAIYNVMMGL